MKDTQSAQIPQKQDGRNIYIYIYNIYIYTYIYIYIHIYNIYIYIYIYVYIYIYIYITELQVQYKSTKEVSGWKQCNRETESLVHRVRVRKIPSP